MGLRINADLGVQGDNLVDFLNDHENSKSSKALVKEVLGEIEKPDFKAHLLSRNTHSFPYSLFMVARSVVDTVKLRFHVPSKAKILSESTKVLALTTLPFAALGLTTQVKFLTSSEPKTKLKIMDSSLEAVSEVSNICEGVGLLMEVSIIVLEKARALLPLASILGIASTLLGLANLGVDARGIFKTTHKVSKISNRYHKIKEAFVERFAYKNLSHALNILSTSVTFVAFSLVFFGPQTFLLAGGIVMTSGLAIGFGRILLDTFANQLMKERIHAIQFAHGSN